MELFEMIKDGEYEFGAPAWEHVSDAGKDFIAGLLITDPDKRMNVDQITNHPWYLGDFESNGSLD